jgi:hypothetical protein
MAEAQESGVVIAAGAYEHLPLFPEGAVKANRGSSSDPLKSIVQALDMTVFSPLMQDQNLDRFAESRRGLFQRYIRLIGALAELRPHQSVGQEADATMVAFIRSVVEDDSSLPWDDDCRNEALFCFDTLERAFMVVSEFANTSVLRTKLDKDRELARQFALASMWAQFNLSCLIFAICEPVILSREILDAVVASMRTSVLAYSYARQGYEIRRAASSVETEGLWESEDEAHAQFSSRLGLGLGANQ